MSEKDMAFQVIVGLAKSGQCIDDNNARLIARYLFDIEDSVIEEAKTYRINSGASKLDFGSGYSVPLLTYAARDDTYLYRIQIGYGPRRNVICYSEKIIVNRYALKGGKELIPAAS